ncbi:MAG: hypothetical protein IH793_09665, partial [Acidobacteria bacterium]|nr:hypothetical protein [Acidobacteriota bacterium]
MIAAAVLKRTLPGDESLPFYMELPPYRMPTLRLWTSQVAGSAWAFLRRAGTIILAAALVLWVLLTFPRVDAPAGLDENQAHREERQPQRQEQARKPSKVVAVAQ